MAKEPRPIRTNRLFHGVLKLTLGVWLRVRFNVHTRNRRILSRLKPPYLLLPNHVGYWDPFILGSVMPHPVCFLAADANFRSRRLASLLSLVGTIPKSKGISDLEAIRQMMRIRDRGDVIALFAEGERTWDGGPLPLIPATAKLVRLLAIPVVTPIFRGGHLSHPRWARFARRGRITVDFRLAIDADEVRRLTAEQIADRITPAIAHDAWQEQKHNPVAYRGRRLAEGLEHVLHVCPRCHELGTIGATGNIARCRACDFRVRYNRYGFFQTGRATPDAEPVVPHTVREWSRFQTPIVRRWVETRRQLPDQPLFSASRVHAGRGYRSRTLEVLPEGRLSLYPDYLLFEPGGGNNNGALRFNLGEIAGLNIQHVTHLEFYCHGGLYSFRPRDHRVPVHLWRTVIRLLRGEYPGGSLPESAQPGIVIHSHE